MNKEYKEKILKTGLEGFLIGVAIGVAAGIFYFFGSLIGYTIPS